ncbi:DUF6747 family protein [Leptobacterium flavescens]|uniref:DUF6747 family protein n=1 Tax=Leptobacterium flavescens TaxID=472055 RepID=UPI0019535CC0|nr:DUF6747 family protein [Leptobacterium flavescens]
MRIFLLFKELYVDAFKGIGGPAVAILKPMSWLCFACISIVLYAFVYRVMTGFPFF